VACGGETTAPPENGGNGEVLSVTLDPDRDNTLYEDPNGALSNGAGEFIFAGRTSLTAQGAIRRALLHFDVTGSAIPAGSTVDSVRLRMNMSRTIAGPATVTLHRVTSDWGEAGSDATGAEGTGTASQTGDATWIHAFFGTAQWATAGGDFVGAAGASREVLTTGPYTWESTASMVADVQGWLDNASTNFGWILIGDENVDTTAKRFDSRDNSVAANRPKLTIFYSQP
jgi:hypothetical protein